MSCLANAFEPSISAAARERPEERRCPAARTASPRPGHERRLGPAHDQVGAARRPRAADQLGDRVGRRSGRSASSARGDARVAGRARRAARTSGLCASFQASACSRPPDPTRKIAIPCAQCRKWRSPVSTIAMPCSSAAAIDLVVAHRAARLDDGDARPPWPPRRRRRGTGRTRRRRARDPASGARAFETAMRTESTRDICPAPTPSVRPPAGEHDGVRLDVLADAPGEVESAQLRRRRRALA